MEKCDACDCDPFEYLQWPDHDADLAMLKKLMTKEVCGFVEPNQIVDPLFGTPS